MRCASQDLAFTILRTGACSNEEEAKTVFQCVCQQAKYMLDPKPKKDQAAIYLLFCGDADDYAGRTAVTHKSKSSWSGPCIRWDQHQRALIQQFFARTKNARSRYKVLVRKSEELFLRMVILNSSSLEMAQKK